VCYYVIICICVYFWLGIVEFGVEGYFSHFGLRGVFVILRIGVIL
jgi:hypothetical protein